MGRLAPALALSVLLHGVAILLPALGERSLTGRAESAARAERGVLAARLTDRADNPLRSRELSAAGEPNREATASQGSTGNATHAAQAAADGAGLLPLPAPAYFPAEQLSKRPQAVRVAELDPEATRQIVVSGTMIVQLWINERGHVVNAEVEQSGLPPIFSETVIDAFLRSRFVPGERAGRRVGSLLRIEVRYDDRRLTSRFLLTP